MVTTSTTSTNNGTCVFDAAEILTNVRYQVFSITGRKPRFEIYVGGKLEQTIPATRQWQAEQRQAIQWCQEELGWRDADGKPNTGPAQAHVAGSRQLSDRRIAQMALLYADTLAERGCLEEPAELIKRGRTYAEGWAELGSKAFTEEMNRLRAERNEHETRWSAEAKAKVTYY